MTYNRKEVVVTINNRFESYINGFRTDALVAKATRGLVKFLNIINAPVSDPYCFIATTYRPHRAQLVLTRSESLSSYGWARYIPNLELRENENYIPFCHDGLNFAFGHVPDKIYIRLKK